jgi:hypothetical protein
MRNHDNLDHQVKGWLFAVGKHIIPTHENGISTNLVDPREEQ